MGILGTIIAIVITSAVCRALRAHFKAVDSIACVIILIVFIHTWITEGFWMGLLYAFITGTIVTLIFGWGEGTEVHDFGHKYTLKCDKCGYEKLDIMSHTDDGVVITKCQRCGHVCTHTLIH